jgi:mRNA-degrading endonuclease RelE of RelBE toxin-antitoxin system
MSYKIIVLSPAQKEIIEIKKWYRSKVKGLENDFVFELKENIKLIKQNPLLFQIKYNNLRAIPLKRFPYLVYYLFENETIFILAVIAFKQDQQVVLTK